MLIDKIKDVPKKRCHTQRKGYLDNNEEVTAPKAKQPTRIRSRGNMINPLERRYRCVCEAVFLSKVSLNTHYWATCHQTHQNNDSYKNMELTTDSIHEKDMRMIEIIDSEKSSSVAIFAHDFRQAWLLFNLQAQRAQQRLNILERQVNMTEQLTLNIMRDLHQLKGGIQPSQQQPQLPDDIERPFVQPLDEIQLSLQQLHLQEITQHQGHNHTQSYQQAHTQLVQHRPLESNLQSQSQPSPVHHICELLDSSHIQ